MEEPQGSRESEREPAPEEEPGLGPVRRRRSEGETSRPYSPSGETGSTPPPPPPPQSPPPPESRRPARRGRGCLWTVFVLFLLVGLGIGVIAYYFARNFSGTAEWQTESGITITQEVLEKGTTEQYRIAVIDVHGVIVQDGLPYDGAVASILIEQLDAARDDPRVAAVVLDMNTPGGGVTASDEIHQAVLRLREAGKPVVTCMRAVAASGGYLVACGTDHIVANRLTVTGSIGVIMASLNYAELFRKVGLDTIILKSGKMKDLLAGSREPTEKEKEFVQGLVDETFREFAAIVADGRDAYDTSEAVANAPFGDGRILSGQRAYEFGLVDQLGYFEDAVAKARELAGIPGAGVVRYRRPRRLLDLLLRMQQSRGSALAGLLPEEWRAIRPGRLYYLMPTALPR